MVNGGIIASNLRATAITILFLVSGCDKTPDKSSDAAIQGPSTDGAINIVVPKYRHSDINRPVGDDYWVYVNGNIASSPPHESMTTFLTFDPGHYRIDVLFYSPSNSGYDWPSYPFVISKTYDEDITASSTSLINIKVPFEYSNSTSLPHPARLSVCSGRPDIGYIESLSNEYTSDPIVISLKSAKPDNSGSLHDIILNLPDNFGGTREYDKVQINHIVDEVKAARWVDYTNDVARCRSSYPEYSETYDQILSVMEKWNKEIESFRTLSGAM